MRRLLAIYLGALAAAGAWLSSAMPASAETDHRIALVIGNAAYQDVPLANPVNDARGMAESLRRLDFDVVALENATLKQMQHAVVAFGEKLKEHGTVGLFYYAGHGMQVKGQNYLIPVDAELEHEADAFIETLPVELVTEQMGEADNRVNLIIL